MNTASCAIRDGDTVIHSCFQVKTIGSALEKGECDTVNIVDVGGQ